MLTVLRKIFPHRTSVTEEAELKRRNTYLLLRPESAPPRRTKSQKRRNILEQQIQSAPSFLVDKSLGVDKLNLQVEIALSESHPSTPSSLLSPLSFDQRYSSPLSFDKELNIIDSDVLGEGTRKPSPKLASQSSSGFSMTNEFNRLERKVFTDENEPVELKLPSIFTKHVEEGLPEGVLKKRIDEVQFTPPSSKRIGLDRHIKQMLLIDEEEAWEIDKKTQFEVVN